MYYSSDREEKAVREGLTCQKCVCTLKIKEMAGLTREHVKRNAVTCARLGTRNSSDRITKEARENVLK